QYQQKSYAVVNLLARYELTRHLDLTLNLENAFDKRYRTNVSQHNIGAPRNFMLTARYQF
ncbi:MAG: TonB-dependent receptor, partial [Burkholderiales bacterium]|nr:TonB-dependent receptor [Burkholderiales bacterium]